MSKPSRQRHYNLGDLSRHQTLFKYVLSLFRSLIYYQFLRQFERPRAKEHRWVAEEREGWAAGELQ